MENEITILGSNGTKGLKGGTSAFLIDRYNAIDAGNLLIPLQEASALIETIWLTHSHLDHILDIAYILDSYFSERTVPLTIKGLPETLDAIKEHFLNDLIWPDFAKINMHNDTRAILRYEPITLNEVYTLGPGRTITPFKTDHTVVSCGYVIHHVDHAVLITADTYDLSEVIKKVDEDPRIQTLVIECSFPSYMSELAKTSKHLTPALLFKGLKPLQERGIKLYINHIKPLCKKLIIDDIAQEKGSWKVKILQDGEKIHF